VVAANIASRYAAMPLPEITPGYNYHLVRFDADRAPRAPKGPRERATGVQLFGKQQPITSF